MKLVSRTSTATGGAWTELKSAIGWIVSSWLRPADRDARWEQSVGKSPPTRGPSVRGQTSHPQVTSSEKSTPRGGG